METVLAILMALGIYLVIPVLIGFAMVGIFILGGRRARRDERARAAAAAEAEVGEPVQTPVGVGKVTG